MEKKDYNAPTMENMMRLIKDLHNKLCPWIECPECGKAMKDTGFDMCYECKQKKGGTDIPAGDSKTDLSDF